MPDMRLDLSPSADLLFAQLDEQGISHDPIKVNRAQKDLEAINRLESNGLLVAGECEAVRSRLLAYIEQEVLVPARAQG